MSEPVDVEHKASLHIFLFFLFLVLLNWPFILVAAHDDGGGVFFLYAFAVWSILVLAMLIVSLGYGARLAQSSQEKK